MLANWSAGPLAVQNLSDADKIQAIIAFFAGVTALATAGIFLLAWLQLRSIRAENRKWETVRACNALDVDPILDKAGAEIMHAAGLSQDYSDKAMVGQTYNIITILNAYDALQSVWPKVSTLKVSSGTASAPLSIRPLQSFSTILCGA